MSKVGRRLEAAFAKLDALYARLPTIACAGRCAISCGPILLTDLEARRLQLATHTAPRTTPDDRCIYLTPAGRCRAYAVRPLICRAYGLVRALSCPFGCLPSTWLTDPEFAAIARDLEAFAGGRELGTCPEGVYEFEKSFSGIGRPRRSAEAIERNSERTRNLRALHGGYILAAVDETDK